MVDRCASIYLLATCFVTCFFHWVQEKVDWAKERDRLETVITELKATQAETSQQQQSLEQALMVKMSPRQRRLAQVSPHCLLPRRSSFPQVIFETHPTTPHNASASDYLITSPNLQYLTLPHMLSHCAMSSQGKLLNHEEVDETADATPPATDNKTWFADANQLLSPAAQARERLGWGTSSKTKDESQGSKVQNEQPKKARAASVSGNGPPIQRQMLVELQGELDKV